MFLKQSLILSQNVLQLALHFFLKKISVENSQISQYVVSIYSTVLNCFLKDYSYWIAFQAV